MAISTILVLASILFISVICLFIIYQFGSTTFKDGWWKFSVEEEPIKGFYSESSIVLFIDLIIVASILLFKSSMSDYINQVLPHPLFLFGLLIIIAIAFYHCLFRLPKILLFRIKEFHLTVHYENISKTHFKNIFTTYIPYAIYASCAWGLLIYTEGILIIYSLLSELRAISSINSTVGMNLKNLVDQPDPYIKMLNIVRNDFGKLAGQISDMVFQYAFLFGLVSILMIIITCTKVGNIYSQDIKKIMQWIFVIIVFILGPSILIISTIYYAPVYVEKARLINSIIESSPPRTAQNIFYLDSVRVYFQNNFKPKIFFTEYILNIKSLAFWLIPLLTVFFSKTMAKFNIYSFANNLFPKPVNKLISKILFRSSRTS